MFFNLIKFYLNKIISNYSNLLFIFKFYVYNFKNTCFKMYYILLIKFNTYDY